MQKYSFEPLVNNESIILILGTMPGDESLRQGRYYANPKNQFWQLIYHQFEIPIHSKYEERCAFLLNNKIALWDVLESADRLGSLDKDIQKEIPNDFDTFFKEYPNIKYIFFNGGTAEKLFKKHCSNLYNKMNCTVLPSSSATPGKNVKSFEEKVIAWSIISKKMRV